MSIYIWEGPEEELALFCAATRFEIESITEDQLEKGLYLKYARGSISGKDYMEGGIVFTDPWVAESVSQGDGISNWVVKRPKDDNAFWINRDTQEAEFTANSEVNRAMKEFIAQKINHFLETGEAREGPEKYTGPKYTGPIEKYSGPCVCQLLEASSPTDPFDWQTTTNGGHFPQNCFECSCGTRWWCDSPEEHSWVRVGDDAAWKMFLEYNGVAVQFIGVIEEKAYLMQTLRNQGLIPIG